MKTFNLNLNLFLFSTFGLFLSLLSGVFAQKIEALNKITPLSKIPIYFENFHELTFIISLLLLLCLIILVTVEIVTRLAQDSLSNYFDSIIATFKVRRFGFQSERVEQATPNIQGKSTLNPIYHDFNKSVRKSVVDISDSQVLVFIKVPRSQQAQKILKEMEQLLKEEISSQNPDYYFSSPERIKNGLWFTGNRR